VKDYLMGVNLFISLLRACKGPLNAKPFSAYRD
jgi:hypothetical protein